MPQMDLDQVLQQRSLRMPLLYQDPRRYRTQGQRVVVILADVIAPLLVAGFGILASLCTLWTLL